MTDGALRHSLMIVLVCAAVTLLTRAAPFALFPGKKKLPRALEEFGKALRGAVMGMLVVYCFRNTPVLAEPHAAPEIIASLVTVGLYLWKRNILLPIALGTAVYMALTQAVFA